MIDFTEDQLADFWDAHNNTAKYYGTMPAANHPYFELLNEFITKYDLQSKKCLEIGSGGGCFQDMVDNYTGCDIAPGLLSFYHKPFIVTDGYKIPLPSESFDAIWTINAHEHIPNIQNALCEIKRLLKTGGLVFFAPAFHTRPWFAGGY